MSNLNTLTTVRPKDVSPRAALHHVLEQFPFKQYMVSDNGSYLDVANTVVQCLPAGAKILDFGCGPCDKTAVLQFLGYDCTGYDDLSDAWHQLPGNRAHIQKFARDCGVNFILAEGRSLPFAAHQFDMVMAHGVLEHLHDSPRDLLNDLVSLLKPGGLLFVTVPNAVNLRKRLGVLRGRTNLPPYDYFFWHPGPWRGHVREYVKDDLAQFSQYLDLEIVELRGCDHMLDKVPRYLRPGWVAATNCAPGLKDSWKLVARKPENWLPRKQLEPEQASALFAAAQAFLAAA